MRNTEEKPPRQSDTKNTPLIALLGMRFAAIGRGELVRNVSSALRAGRGGWIITANVDYLQRHASNDAAARLYDSADLIVADGIPILWAAKLQRTPLPDRVAGSDLVWLLTAEAARSGFSIYVLGGVPAAAEEAVAAFRERFPGLLVAGVSSPVVSDEPTQAEIEAIRSDLVPRKPDIIYVALGAPKEERVIAALRDQCERAWWIGVGISLSFVSGRVRRAPLWMQRWSLEWLHRLVQEPRRLGRRYLIRNLPFAVRLLARSALIGLRSRLGNEARP